MSARKKTLLILSSFILLTVAFILVYLQTTKPIYAGELSLKNISAPVTVYHDTYGVPHIYGKTETDVYRALGYLVAQERLFQMEMIRRVSSGRLSELFWKSASRCGSILPNPRNPAACRFVSQVLPVRARCPLETSDPGIPRRREPIHPGRKDTH